MTPQKLGAFLQRAFNARRQVLCVGAPGVGKTGIITQSAQAAGFDLIITHPAVSDPTDYKGLPARAESNGQGSVDHATFLPFGDLHRAITATKPTVFFVDDLGQASEAVQKALMQLLWGRRLNGHKLPAHIVFCGATNDVAQRSGVSGMLEPVKSRWHTIVKLETSLDDWCQWAIAAGHEPELIAFMRTRPELLHKFEPTRDLTNSPCPRTWEMTGDWLKDKVTEFEVIAGAVGKGAATEFLAFIDMAKNAPSLDAILLNPDSEPVPDEPSLRYLVAAGLAHRATQKNMGRVARYLARLPQAFRVLSYKDAAGKDPSVTQTAAFIEWVTTEGKEFI